MLRTAFWVNPGINFALYSENMEKKPLLDLHEKQSFAV